MRAHRRFIVCEVLLCLAVGLGVREIRGLTVHSQEGLGELASGEGERELEQTSYTFFPKSGFRWILFL